MTAVPWCCLLRTSALVSTHVRMRVRACAQCNAFVRCPSSCLHTQKTACSPSPLLAGLLNLEEADWGAKLVDSVAAALASCLASAGGLQGLCVLLPLCSPRHGANLLLARMFCTHTLPSAPPPTPPLCPLQAFKAAPSRPIQAVHASHASAVPLTQLACVCVYA